MHFSLVARVFEQVVTFSVHGCSSDAQASSWWARWGGDDGVGVDGFGAIDPECLVRDKGESAVYDSG